MDRRLNAFRNPTEPRSEVATGVLFGLIAYVWWGIFPIYFHLLDRVSPIEVVAHRVIWSLVLLLVIVAVTRNWRQLRSGLTLRRVLLLAVAAAVLTVNWGVYVYAVTSNQIVESSLGYFINPLVSVAFGVVLLKERLRPLQWSAIALAGIAVVVLTIATGALPWIGLTLAASFGIYGLLKKYVGLGAVQSLTVETAVLLPAALAVLLVMEGGGGAAFGQEGIVITLLLIGLGPVTAIPLLAFGGASTRIPLYLMGIMQYLTPSLTFLIGWLVYGEQMSRGRWLGFAMVWMAVAIFTADTVRATLQGRQDREVEELEVGQPT